MSITISLPPETEAMLRERAAASGQTVDGYVRQLVERGLLDTGNGERTPTTAPSLAATCPGRTLDDVLAPLREEFAQSGMTEEELVRFLTEVRDEVRREKRARKVS